MGKVYLFDWGDTLMIDFPDQTGKMCDWGNIQAVNGALQTLEALSKEHQIYVATNAADSYDKDIEPAVTVGIQAIWFNPMAKIAQGNHEVKEIRKLSELCT
ncbi:hypothetical protein WOC23_22300 [Vibrio parahaemolyticus]